MRTIFIQDRQISIHAAREGGDQTRQSKTLCPLPFQSTPPVKAATGGRGYTDSLSPISIHAAREGGDGVTRSSHAKRQISIHAAREGGDGRRQRAVRILCDFNPRRP